MFPSTVSTPTRTPSSLSPQTRQSGPARILPSPGRGNLSHGIEFSVIISYCQAPYDTSLSDFGATKNLIKQRSARFSSKHYAPWHSWYQHSSLSRYDDFYLFLSSVIKSFPHLPLPSLMFCLETNYRDTPAL